MIILHSRAFFSTDPLAPSMCQEYYSRPKEVQADLNLGAKPSNVYTSAVGAHNAGHKPNINGVQNSLSHMHYAQADPTISSHLLCWCGGVETMMIMAK